MSVKKFSVLALLLANAGSVFADDISNRLSRLEILLNNHALVDTLAKVEILEGEIQELRGVLEVQENEIQRLRKSQQQLFTDLERKVDGISKIDSAVQVDSKEDEKKKTTTQKVSKLTEKEMYDVAYKYVRAKSYNKAVSSLEEYLTAYPNGSYSPNALYWLGEVFIVKWNNEKQNIELQNKAIAAFEAVTKNFPEHQKSVDCLLKLGMIASDNGNYKLAKSYLETVKTKYPQSAPAKIAVVKLQRLRQEGKI